MERIALHNKDGMTLIEVMISLLILMFVSLAVLQTAMMGMSANLQNSMRDEAVNVVDFRMNEIRDAAFDGTELSLVSNVTETPVPRAIRGVSVTYTPMRTVSSINADTKQITMSVGWKYRGKDYTHSVTTIVRRP